MKNDNIKNFSFRDLSINDVDLLFEWINDVDARKLSFNPRSINKKDHINWFKRIINSKNVYIWIFLLDIDVGDDTVCLLFLCRRPLPIGGRL